jgi:glycosyltransferase involved in cell wall biosynthesis
MLTVAVPTRDRAAFLKISLESVICQHCCSFDVVVLDNASTDFTSAMMRDFDGDDRVRYIRHPHAIPVNENWNAAIAANRQPYVCVFHDDDIMMPGFLQRSVAFLEDHPTAAFCFTSASCVDHAGTVIGSWYEGGIPAGLIEGIDYIHLTVASGRCITLAPTVVYRASAFEALGGFESPHSANTFDLNLFIRAATAHDVGFIDEELVQYRVHSGQMTEKHWRSGRETGRVGAMAELIDAVGRLASSAKAEEPGYRRWLAERLCYFNKRRSEMARTITTDL